jgi:hypothetical protein
MFLSVSSTSPIVEVVAQYNPQLVINPGGTGSLYMWWLPATDSTPSGREELTNFSHDIVSSNPVLTRTGGSYLIDNPGGSRWQSTNNVGNTAAAPTYIWDNVTAANIAGWATSTTDPLYDSASGAWRVASMTFNNDGLGFGTTYIRIGVGSAKINFNTSPTNGRPIYFGWGDAPIAGNANVNGSNTTTVAEASFVYVPEPSTLAMLGLGMIGLATVARRRRS